MSSEGLPVEDRWGPKLPGNQTFTLHALPLELAVAPHGFRPFAGALLGGLLIGAAQLHLPEDAFTLHLLLQGLEGLVDVVVADNDLNQGTSPLVDLDRYGRIRGLPVKAPLDGRAYNIGPRPLKSAAMARFGRGPYKAQPVVFLP